MKKKTYKINTSNDVVKIFRKLEKKKKIKNICYNIFISLILTTTIILIGLLIAILVVN